MKLITQEQQDFYHENGYLIIDDLYPEELILKFENCIRRHANKDFAAIINPDRFDILKEFDERPKSDVTLEEIKAYVEKDEPLMSSGSYKYESYGKELFESINGDPFVIQGLPLEAIKNFFR